MRFPYELKIGLRYAFSAKGRGRDLVVSIISFFSSAGIALGVAALIVVLSVMNGFQKELRTRILSVASHIEIRAFPQVEDWHMVEQVARQNPHVQAVAPYVIGQAMLSYDSVSRGSLVRGIAPDAENTVADIEDHMLSGSLDDLRSGEFGIVIGMEQARMLGVGMGDDIVVIVPQGSSTPVGTVPRMRSFKVAGIFDIGMYEYDSGLALVHIDDAQRLYRMTGVSGVRLKLDDLFNAPVIGREISDVLPFNLEETNFVVLQMFGDNFVQNCMQFNLFLVC